MTKPQLLAEVAKVVVGNWIATGDQPESMREKNESKVKRIYAKSSAKQLESILTNITRV